MGSISQELSLDLKPTLKSKVTRGFLREINQIDDVSMKKLKYDEYVRRLDEEMKKVDAFKRELPLCMLLLKDAIVGLKEESMKFNVVEEKDSKDKKNWMSSAQLWSSNGDSVVDEKDIKSIDKIRQVVVTEKNTSTKNPFSSECKYLKKKKKSEMVTGFPAATMNRQTEPVFENWVSNNIFSSQGMIVIQSNLQKATPPPPTHSQKKQRRCWSPELHRRFVSSLQQLGGSQVATPKQIRELMKVDGLTNDEVKSHLQKYRLHIQRVPIASKPEHNSVVEWVGQNQLYETSKSSSNSDSGSPQGPFQLGGTGGGISSTTTTGGISIEDEDMKSESYGLER